MNKYERNATTNEDGDIKYTPPPPRPPTRTHPACLLRQKRGCLVAEAVDRLTDDDDATGQVGGWTRTGGRDTKPAKHTKLRLLR